MLVIIDYNVGNLKSVQGAFSRIGLETVVTRNHELIKQAQAIVLPGVGTFPVAMENLKKYDLIDILNDRKDAGIPILGICLGMQILFEKGYEIKETKGLGFIPGTVNYMDIDEKVPHMGWNQLYFQQNHPILKNIHENDDVYFVHSYYLDAKDKEIVAATTNYGVEIDAAVQRGNIIATQFHPEKSGDVGLKMLKNFVEMVK